MNLNKQLFYYTSIIPFFLIFSLLINLSNELYGQGTLTNAKFYSNSLQMERNYQIYLPEGYNKQDATRYPVIYFLHGATLDYTYYQILLGILNNLIDSGSISPVIVVKPDGSVGPWGGSFYTNSELYGNFEDCIVDDLIEYIDNTYNTIASRDKRSIMGHSMGGYGAMKLAFNHPDKYCGAASHSAALDYSHFPDRIPGILSENGGVPVSEYIPSRNKLGTYLFYTLAGAYTPNLDNSPYPVDFPLDSMGVIIDSVFNKWLQHDPARLAKNLNMDSDLAIYFDCGMQDELLTYPFNTGFADSLDKLNLEYEFQSFAGGHMDKLSTRLPISIEYLDSVMNENQNNTESAWTFKAPMPTARTMLGGCVLDGKIYAIGGFIGNSMCTSVLEVYNPSTDTWIQKASMPVALCYPKVCALDGKIYVFGGSTGVFSGDRKDVFVYNPATDEWTQINNTPHAYGGTQAVVDNMAYLIGGAIEGSLIPVPDVSVYDPISESWTNKTDMPTPRSSLAACVFENKIYCMGGTNQDWGNVFYRTVETYSPVQDVWEIKNDMPIGRWGLAACSLNNMIYVTGGQYGANSCDNVDILNPLSDVWTSGPPMQQVRRGHVQCALNGKIFVIGGSYTNNGTTIVLPSVEVYEVKPTSNIDGGNVSGTWTQNGSPYYINGEITIPDGSTLTIEPGVEVVFTGHYKFNVQGRLLAIGTETDTIIFTINDTTGSHNLTIPDGGWHGIRFIDTPLNNDSSKIVYCKLQYGKANTGAGFYDRAGGALCVNINKLLVSHCLFSNNMTHHPNVTLTGGGGIYMESSPIIEFCEFTKNASIFGAAICVWGDNTHPLIRNNYFHHNRGHGTINIGSWDGSNTSPVLINNIITDNLSTGHTTISVGHGIIHFSNGHGTPVLINNTIVNNSCTVSGGGIFVNIGPTPLLINNIIYGNVPSQVDLLTQSTLSFKNCLIEGGKEGFTGATYSGTYEKCIDSDPLFIDETNSDFHLSDESPCIGTGYYEVGLTPTCDCKGNERPNPKGSMPDIGAYESPAGIVGVENNELLIPTEYALYQNYPNPFNPNTLIKYSIPQNAASGFNLGNVQLKIYDILGREVATLVNEKQKPGNYEVEWSANDTPSGVYFYKIRAGEFFETKKMLLIK